MDQESVICQIFIPEDCNCLKLVFILTEMLFVDMGDHYRVTICASEGNLLVLFLFSNFMSLCFHGQCSTAWAKETTLERADFALQLPMFVTAEKERDMFIIFFLSSFCQLLSPRF